MTAVVGLDLGATNVRLRFGSAESSEQCSIALANHGSGRAELSRLRRACEELVRTAGSRFSVAVLACAPSLDSRGRVATWPNRPHWIGEPVVDTLEDALQCKVLYEDDCNAGAFAEASVRGVDSLVYVGLGTGVGGGLIIDGRIYGGARGRAAELGHAPGAAEPEAICVCGRRGCLQAYASGVAILRCASEHGEEISCPSELHSALSAGRPSALHAVQRAANALGDSIVAWTEMLDPQLVVIGGAVAVGLPSLVDKAAQRALSRARTGQTIPTIARAVYGTDAPLEGAWLLAKRAAEHPMRRLRELLVTA